MDRFDFFPQLSQKQPGWLPIETQKLLSVHYLALPVRVPPFDKPLVRQAISYAVDKQAIDPRESSYRRCAFSVGHRTAGDSRVLSG